MSDACHMSDACRVFVTGCRRVSNRPYTLAREQKRPPRAPRCVIVQLTLVEDILLWSANRIQGSGMMQFRSSERNSV